ncbi:anthrone oxygenase family protein [Alteromonas lipolytica]|uniref:DUF1772 domain-containing protein n=1 Tax=Alteromonas lipolytica TaxID=1856405 RepID=A0A1E8F8C9_9ALTE|nr:anthrone oxygenase family protein [Alteromonas lipolytica]OFI32172.1 hypothetical protein BFC17_08060 [Alteromonas lipolytica]GGF83311.1 membrane protein [Alteromonas lipolytica]
MQTLITVLCGGLCALMAGIYFAFSVIVMPSLSRLPAQQGATTMRQINRDILSSAFMLLFWGSSVLTLAALFTSPSAMTWLAGGLYLGGMLIVTAVGNVPLNRRLEEEGNTNGEAVWQHYLVRWTFWNHVRTASAAVSAGLFLVAV